MIKIYVHHYFSKSLFYKLAHNTINREYDIDVNVGKVTCEYNNVNFEFIFNPTLHDKTDGYHLLDFFTALRNKNQYDDYKDLDVSNGVEDLPFLKRFSELLKDRSGWIINVFRTEKLFALKDAAWADELCEIDKIILSLNNHKIVTDNLFFYETIDYKNIHYAFTNTIFQWNELIGIRWYYEFKQIFDKLNFDYDIMYSVRNHKIYRMDILKGLYELNNSKILLQRTNALLNKDYSEYAELVTNIQLNDVRDGNDFENLTWISWIDGIGVDLFFRVLPKAKLQILDESWAWSKQEFASHYLSEKSIGIILAGIPFISTHSYPLQMVEKMIGIRPHPFMKDFEIFKGEPKLFVKFIENFMKDFESNYKLCKEWSDECHSIFIDRINSENSILDMFIRGFDNIENAKKSKLQLI
jgi:hypothetical protein